MRRSIVIGLMLGLGTLFGCDCGNPEGGEDLSPPQRDSGTPGDANSAPDVTVDLFRVDLGPQPDLVPPDQATPDSNAPDHATTPDHASPPDRVTADGGGPVRLVIARWDFEDEDDIVDEGYADNRANTITTSGNRPNPAYPSGYDSGAGSGKAASFSSLNQQNQSYVEIPVDCRGFVEVHLRYAARCSNTASKYWKVQLSVGGGAFQDLDGIIELVGSEWLGEISFDLLGVEHASNVRVRLVPTDSAGDGSGVWIQADGEGEPTAAGTFRIDDVLITGVLGDRPEDAGLEDRGEDASMTDLLPTDTVSSDGAADAVTGDVTAADGTLDIQPRDAGAGDVSVADATHDTVAADNSPVDAPPDVVLVDVPDASGDATADATPADVVVDTIAVDAGSSLPDRSWLNDIEVPEVEVTEYEGEAEDGVVCGDVTCDKSITCCVGLVAPVCDGAGAGCGPLTIPVPCDGPEDCGDGQVCCATGTPPDLVVACADAPSCAGTRLCATSADCSGGMVCCSAGVLNELGLDIGWCETDHCGL